MGLLLKYSCNHQATRSVATSTIAAAAAAASSVIVASLFHLEQRSTTTTTTTTTRNYSNDDTSSTWQPNQTTATFTKMQSSCPEVMKSYATCVIEKQNKGVLELGCCEEEYTKLMDCFRASRVWFMVDSIDINIIYMLGWWRGYTCIIIMRMNPSKVSVSRRFLHYWTPHATI